MSDSFGQILKQLRLKAGLTQQKLADYINVSLKTVQRWEKNERQPRIEEVKKLALALHVSESDLFYDYSTQNQKWVLTVKIAHDFKEEVIDLRKGIEPISIISTSKDGGVLTLGGNYELWTDDNCFKKLIADLKKLRATVIQNGVALGGIKQQR